MKTARSPFLFGAQYYRAPTPDESCWEADHARMAALGFNSVKYWVQWRWSHKRGDRFVFDDVLRLMDLAHKHGLAVTLNVIFDVAPHWLYENYPDAKPIMNSGRVIEPDAPAHRQIGGSLGPSFFHEGARAERERFLAATVEAFKDHPALDMWDLWNEPELAVNQRMPSLETLADYNPRAIAAFRVWLEKKYGTLSRLNAVWGRCYELWSEVEVPRTGLTIQDFIDWREFHIDALTAEARWRFELVRSRDPHHVLFLHTVPNLMWCWNSIAGCADDFALAGLCDLYAASYNGGGQHVPQLTSAAAGKIVYNTETHINFGLTNMHPGEVDLTKLLTEFLPQIGMGVRGFQFWQFRAETLGFEAPAWGVVKPDGTDRPITRAVEEFWRKLAPYADALPTCPPPATQVGVWKSQRNEIFHFAIHGKLQPLIESVCAYVDALYWGNIPYRVVDDKTLAAGRLDGLKFLILPSPYYLTQPEADALREFVNAGGTVWTEAHLAGYDGTRGRHSAAIPGCGLAEAWGVRELDSTSSYRLTLEQSEAFQGAMSEDVKKALLSTGTTGGKFFPIRRANASIIWGAERCAWLENMESRAEFTPAGNQENSRFEPVGEFDRQGPLLAKKRVGERGGTVWLHGTNLGEASSKDVAAFRAFLCKALTETGICPTATVLENRPETSANEIRNVIPSETNTNTAENSTSTPAQIHVDALEAANGQRFLVINNKGITAQTITLSIGNEPGNPAPTYRGLWSGHELTAASSEIPAGLIDLFVEV